MVADAELTKKKEKKNAELGILKTKEPPNALECNHEANRHSCGAFGNLASGLWR